MSLLRTQKAASSRDPAGMDEILASIRRIIDEEPMNLRHRVPVSAAVLNPVSDFVADASGRSDITSPFDFGQDDVLAELLAEPPSLAAVEVSQADKEANRDAVIFAAAETEHRIAAVRTEIVTSVDSGGAALSGPGLPPDTLAAFDEPAVKPPQENVPSAEDVLAALALGLSDSPGLSNNPDISETLELSEPLDTSELPGLSEAEAPVLVAVVGPALDDVVAETASPDAPVGLNDFVEPSPAEAVAAAVAAVAAVNAAAVQTGVRPRTNSVSNTVLDTLETDSAVAEGAAGTEEPVLVEQSGSDAPLVMQTPVPDVAAESLDTGVIANFLPASVELYSAPETAGQSGAHAAGELVPQPPVSFEDAISGMLRPMLRDWLDDNMPRMVEKALKEELSHSGGLIARVGCSPAAGQVKAAPLPR